MSALYSLYHRSPRLTVMTVVLLLVAGIGAWSALPRQEDPRLTPRVAIVTTRMPGATASRIEAQITEPIEREIRRLAEVDTVSSTSSPGVSVIVAEIEETITPAEVARAKSRIRDAVDDARLPPAALAPDVDDDRFGAYTLVAGLRWTGTGTVDRGMLRRLARDLQDRLLAVPGTQLVRVYGAPAEEVEVRLRDRSALLAGWSPARIAAAIERADAKAPAGRWTTRTSAHGVAVSGDIDSLDRIRRIVLESRPNGALLVGDLADVRFTTESPAREGALLDGHQGVMVAARILPDAKTGPWARGARAAVAEQAAELPSAIDTVTVFDQSRYTEARLTELGTNLAVSAGLVLVVLLLTLGFRSALVVTLSLPLTLLMAVAGLFYLGIPLHQMSITGLIVALGLLVDNGIVMTDAVRQRLLAGETRGAAVGASVKELWLPLLASTVTTVIAFLPIVLLPGTTGEFVGAIGVSVVLTVTASYLVAVTLVAAVAGHVLGRSERVSRWDVVTRLRAPIGLGAKALLRATLGRVLRAPRRSLAVLAAIPVAGFLLAGTLPNQFFPPSDRDQLQLRLQLPGSVSLERTERVVRTVEAILRSDDAVVSTHWSLGRSSPSFYYNVVEGIEGAPSFAQAQVTVTSAAMVQPFMARMQRRLDEEVPEARVVLKELLQGPPVDAPLEVRVQGPEVAVLADLGSQLRQRMSRVEGVLHTTASLDSSQGKVEVVADEAALKRVGLRPADVAQEIGAQLSGAVGGLLVEDVEQLPVRVRGPDGDVAATYLLPGASLGARGAMLTAPIPALAVAHVELRPERGAITRRNGSRVNIVRGETVAGLLPSVAQARFDALLAADPVTLPPGYRLEQGGDAESRGEAQDNLAALVAPLMVFLVAVLVLTFRSFRAAGVIFGVAMASVGLGLLGLAVGGHPFGFQSMIGLFGLMGIAVNDAIVVLTELRHDPAAARGDVEAILTVVADRTSPHVVSTTLTTCVGFLPLLLGGGQFWPPFAWVIAFGVALATVLAFYLVPPAFLLMVRRRVPA